MPFAEKHLQKANLRILFGRTRLEALRVYRPAFVIAKHEGFKSKQTISRNPNVGRFEKDASESTPNRRKRMFHLNSDHSIAHFAHNAIAIFICLLVSMGCSTSGGEQFDPRIADDKTDSATVIPENWCVATSDDRSMRVAFPGEPEQSKSDISAFPVETFVFTANGHTYIFSIMDFSQSPQKFGSHKAAFKACVEGFEQIYSIRSKSEFSWHNLPTVEISFEKTIDKQPLSGISRLLFSMNRNIALTRIGPGTVADLKQDADDFFNSFSFSPFTNVKHETKQNKDNWKKIAGADNRFTFNMPGEPTVKKLKIGGEDFFRYLLLEDETYFIAIYNAGWHSGLDGWVEGLQGNDTLVWKKEFKQEGYPAVKYVIKYREPGDKVAHFTGQCVLVGDTLYSVAMKGPAAPSKWDDSHPFFNSFKLTDLAKKKSNR